MSVYHFPLQKVMDLKEQDKEESKLKYGEAIANWKKGQDELFALQSLRDKWQAIRADSAEHQISIQRLHELESYIKHLGRLLEEKKIEMDVLEERLNLLQQQYTDKEKDFKAWEELKEKSYAVYKDQKDKQEQSEMDEIAILRFARRRGD